ncbi:Cation efflux system protein CusB precursor [compost metagenome]
MTGVLALNERDVAVIQARTAGFVERVYAHAPGDVLNANAALADILVPEWAAAQTEFLALKRSGDAELLAAARQRLQLTGIPAALITQIERSGKVQPYLTLTSPIAGVLQALNVRSGADGRSTAASLPGDRAQRRGQRYFARDQCGQSHPACAGGTAQSGRPPQAGFDGAGAPEPFERTQCVVGAERGGYSHGATGLGDARRRHWPLPPGRGATRTGK